MGATVVGVDFSPVAVQFASERAAAAGLADRVSFVCASVVEAAAATGGSFDGVYASWGVLCWLPDIDACAVAITALLSRGAKQPCATNPSVQ